jgi:two-component system, NtrC family, sensor kinase
MKLAAKIAILLLLGSLPLIVIAESISLQRENDQMLQEMRANASQLARTISNMVDQLWALGDEVRARQVIEQINRLHSTVRVRVVYLGVDRLHPYAPLSPRVTADMLAKPYSDNYQDELGQELLCTYALLHVRTEPNHAAIELAEPIRHINRNSWYFAWHAAVLIGSTFLLGGVIVVAIGSTWIGRPLRRLIEKTRRVGTGDLSGPLELDRHDEFGELAGAINSMCDQLQTAQEKIDQEAQARLATLDQLRHADRLRTVGRLAAGIAHELGTPLNVVSGRAGMIASGRLSEEETRKSAVTIKSEADRIATIIRQLLDFARRNTPQRKAVDLIEVMRQTLALLTPIVEKRHSTLTVLRQPPSVVLNIDSGQIQQVLTNLIVNASEAMPGGGAVEITITCEQATPPGGSGGVPVQYARVDVIDHGDGIAPDVIDQVFEPFFTTKDVGEGTGLGLSIAYGIVKEHGGWIDVRSEVGQGSCFSVYLPMEAAACRDES